MIKHVMLTILSMLILKFILEYNKYYQYTGVFVTVFDQVRQVNNLAGGRDVAFFTININTILNKNDYMFFEIANQTSTTNVTAENDSYFIIEKR